MTTFNAAASPYARPVPAGPASGAAPAPAPAAAGAAPAGEDGRHGSTTDSTLPTPHPHLRLVEDDEQGQTADEAAEAPQSPLASGESAAPQEAEEAAAPVEGFVSAGRFAHMVVPPLRDLVRAQRVALPDLIEYAQTGPYAPQTGFFRTVGKGFNFVWAVPANAVGNSLQWALMERPSRFAFFTALGYATVKGVEALDLHWAVLTVAGLIVWLSIAVVVFKLADPESGSGKAVE